MRTTFHNLTIAHRKCSVTSLLEMDDHGEGFSGAPGTFESVGVGGFVYAGGRSSIDSQGRCVGSEDAEEESPTKNHLFPTVSVSVETEVVVAVNVEKTVVVTGSGVTKLASFRTAKSLRTCPNSSTR